MSKRFIDRLSYQAGPKSFTMPWAALAKCCDSVHEVIALRHMRARNRRHVANQYRGPAGVWNGTRAVRSRVVGHNP